MKYSDANNIKSLPANIVHLQKIFQENFNGFLGFIDPQSNHSNEVKMRQKLTNAEAELSSHMQILNMCSLLSVSDLKGRIIYANDKFCKVSGYTLDELLDNPHNIVRHPDMHSAVFKDMWSTIGKGKVWQGEIKNRKKDGTAYWVLATIAPVMGNNGKPMRYISVRVDITEQKKIEEELREAKKRMDEELFQNITYAKHVHNAFLTPEEEFKTAFPESFLIYRAQKIISGDFYRIERKEKRSIIVLGDSTGHGVSASYISVMALNILNRIIDSKSHYPCEMLKTLNKELNKITHKSKSNPLIESADMIICCIDHEQMQLNYASAKMRGIIIRAGEIIELEKDKCSIGEMHNKKLLLTNRTISLQPKDCIYLFTDGITDQFGGANDKRFSYRTLLNTLKENTRFSMPMQRRVIERMLMDWQGNNEQTDDMTLMGFKI